MAAKKTTKPASAPSSEPSLPVRPATVSRTAVFPVAGIGASAGGLEAFESFFRHLAPHSGIAFVLVPHLDPNHASILSEILQRATTLKVSEATDRVTVQPDHVYIVPPNRDMAIFQGQLHLSVPDQPRGQRMPIDFFFRSLADERAEMAIGIILSGTGSDGTLGLRAIQGAGGICLVQEPDTAKYDGMPQSAIHAGYATHILAVEEMPRLLLEIGKRQAVRSTLPAQAPSIIGSGFDRILLLLRGATGHDFSQYKKSTVARRIERRMVQHQIDDIASYASYLEEHPAEVTRLFKELLINVTSFFRDPEAFAVLKQELFASLRATTPPGYVFRVWVVGCATGEEAYSIAILLRELVDETRQNFKVQIYATDLDEDVITSARIGCFPLNIAQDLTPERLHRFFSQDDAGYHVNKEIREMIIFAVHSVIKDPPFTRLDLLSCRNLLIYLELALQQQLIRNFHYALKPEGLLLLSVSESISSDAELFLPISRQWKLFRSAPSDKPSRTMSPLDLPALPRGKPTDAPIAPPARAFNYADLTHRVLLQSYAPASVLTDAQGNILYVYGDTGRYLSPPPGEATLNIVPMVKPDLQAVLRHAILNAVADNASPQTRDVAVKRDGKLSTVRFSLRKLPGRAAGESMLLMSFEDLPEPPTERGEKDGVLSEAQLHEHQRAEELERELAYHRQTLQATIEAQQSSNEELISINEELQSTNEELQSSNEELETSREELYSLNEELITVNAELHSTIAQLTSVQSDMKNLLDNVSAGTIFLDREFHIRRFTREAQRVYGLVVSDVGRSLADLRSRIDGEDLLARAQQVLDTLRPYESEVRTAKGVSYQVRIQPYRTFDEQIDGVVVTFTDITLRVAAEAERQLALEMAESIVDTVREPLVVLDGHLKVIFASRSFYAEFAVTHEETLGRLLYELGNRQWDISGLRNLLENILPQKRVFDDYLVEQDFPGIGKRKMRLNARSIPAKIGEPKFILLAIENVAEQASVK